MSFNISYLTQHIQNTIILTCYSIKTTNEMFCIFFLPAMYLLFQHISVWTLSFQGCVKCETWTYQNYSCVSCV